MKQTNKLVRLKIKYCLELEIKTNYMKSVNGRHVNIRHICDDGIRVIQWVSCDDGIRVIQGVSMNNVCKFHNSEFVGFIKNMGNSPLGNLIIHGNSHH